MAGPDPADPARPPEVEEPPLGSFERPMAPAEPRRARVGKAVRGLAVDVSPLRSSRDFRLLWSGMLVSETGRQVTRTAIYIQLYALTGSPAAVGLVGLVELVPLALASILGQSIVDALDRRRILLATQTGLAVSSVVLLAGALSGTPPVGLVYAAAGMAAGLSGIDAPTRSAMTPRLVRLDVVPAAIALNQVMWNATMIAGPAIGGVIIGAFARESAGLAVAYGLDVASYAAALGAAAMMRPMPPEPVEAGGEPPAPGLAAIREGFAYLRGRRVLQATFEIDLVAMIFGMPRAVFPVLAVQRFHGGPAIVGMLLSALALGALGGALTAGWVGRVRHQGRAVIWSVATWGACIVLFGAVGANLWLALALLAVAGGADVISAVFRSAILQMSVPDRLRGRLSAIHILVVTGGPRLGDLETGLVASAFSPGISVVSGGVACLAGVAVLVAVVPQLWRYHAGSPA